MAELKLTKPVKKKLVILESQDDDSDLPQSAEEQARDAELTKFVNKYIDTVLNEVQLGLEKEVSDYEAFRPEKFKRESYARAWITVSEFTVRKASAKIKEFMESWQIPGQWMYYITYNGERDTPLVKYHEYEVRWSTPTPVNPIPIATASIFFSFEVAKCKPLYYPVMVYYSFEGSCIVYTPDQKVNAEQTLQDIISAKLYVRRIMDF